MSEKLEWSALSEAARNTMREIGYFGPTTRAGDKLVKGRTPDDDGGTCKTYYTADDLRQMAAAFKEVADWLDKRASLETSNWD